MGKVMILELNEYKTEHTACIAGLDPDSTVLGDYVILFLKFSDRLCQSKATQNHLIRTASPILML